MIYWSRREYNFSCTCFSSEPRDSLASFYEFEPVPEPDGVSCLEKAFVKVIPELLLLSIGVVELMLLLCCAAFSCSSI